MIGLSWFESFSLEELLSPIASKLVPAGSNSTPDSQKIKTIEILRFISQPQFTKNIDIGINICDIDRYRIDAQILSIVQP